jgi:hypothetical protein
MRATSAAVKPSQRSSPKGQGLGIKMSEQFDQVSVIKKANVYFDGKCVSHTIVFADGTKKSVGVIFPSQLVFNTGAPEIMEINGGKCRVRLKGELEWHTYEAGQSFNVAGNSSFDIETLELLDYVCHFG